MRGAFARVKRARESVVAPQEESVTLGGPSIGKGRKMHVRGWILGFVVVGGLWACGSSSNPPPPTDGGGMMTDGGGMTTLPPPVTGDWSCVGSRTAPADGAPVAMAGRLYFFGGTDPVPGATVHVFDDNVVTDDCGGTCEEVTSGADGVATMNVGTDGWFAYRVLAGAGMGNQPVLTIGYNRRGTAMADIPVVGSTILGLLPTLFGRTRTAGTASASGSVADCAGATAANVELRVFVDGMRLMNAPASDRSGFFLGYLTGASPARNPYTTMDGTFASANAPAGNVRVEAWGRMSETETSLTMIGCEAGRLFTDGVTIMAIGPLRSDAPAGCGG